MPKKTTNKTSAKKWFSVSKIDSNKNENISSKMEKKGSSKKSVVKRRKLDLAPTRASAVAIASQANRAKKQELIDKVSSNGRVEKKNWESTKIPTWVRSFFGCSLLLFCVSFYQAIIRPQLEAELTEANIGSSEYQIDWDNVVSLWWNNNAQNNAESDVNVNNNSDLGFQVSTPTTAVETIQEFFARLSNRHFDEAFNLFSAPLQRSSEIREHFTSFRMSPFISWIEWELKPTNLKYISTSTYWRDRYWFDLSYSLVNNGQQYDESWEFVIDTSGNEPRIASIICVTQKCSRHPIFWPESFGMMR